MSEKLPLKQTSKDQDKTLIRFFSILERLYGGERLHKKGLADEYGVSLKTIQRDFNERLKNLNIPFFYSSAGNYWEIDKKFQNSMKSKIYEVTRKQLMITKNLEDSIRDAVMQIDEADAILICAGAGMCVDSGLPDFRGDEGFWNAYPPLKKLGINFQKLANPKFFKDNPSLAWGFYGHRLQLYRDTLPHSGFKILLELVKAKNLNYFIFTSNVDGQFQKAGFDDLKIFECHSSIHYNQCLVNCTQELWSNIESKLLVDKETFMLVSESPKCKNCDQIARPNIVMFGDFSFNRTNYLLQKQRLDYWLKKNARVAKIAIIEIGAGLNIPTVRLFSEEIMTQYDSTLIRINPRDFKGPQGTISISLGAKEALDRIYNVHDK